MLNKMLNTLNDPRKMTRVFCLLSMVFFGLTPALLSFGYAYSAGFAFVGSFVSLFAAAINATITSTTSDAGETTIISGDSSEVGSIG